MKRCLWLIPFLILTGCTFEPRYRRPCIDTPCEWRVESSEETTCANVHWWKSLGDPVLDALITQALKNNKDLHAAAWRVCEFLSRFRITASELYPQADATASANRERFPVQTTFLPQGFDPIQSTYSYAFNVNWEIDIWGRIRSMSHAAFAELMASVDNRRQVVLTLVSTVARSYVLLLQLDRELAIAQATVKDREDYFRLAKRRFEGGLTAEIEVMQALSVLQEAEAVVVTLEKLIPIQENLLSVLLGEPPTCIHRGGALRDLAIPVTIPTGLPSELLCRRPDILEAEHRLIAANASIGAARAAFFPTISLTGLFGGDSFELSTLFSQGSRAWLIGGDLLQPIFTGGRLLGQLRLSEARKRELVASYEQTILNAFKEVNDALISHRQAKELEKVQALRVEAEAQYLHLAWLRYDEGETDYLTVLDAERQLFSAQIDLAKARGDTFLTLVDIYQSLGGGWVIEADSCLR